MSDSRRPVKDFFISYNRNDQQWASDFGVR
jgi:hypothetical protein